ncbi:TPA: DNA-binding protein, partial [Citrobacter freundii]|nr:DNA-binding protein [Citrobacter freundii]
PVEVRERIIAAAEDIYEQLGRETFPTVDTVRRAAKADMNTTSTVMKDWRRQQTTQAVPVAVTVPEAVVQANASALAQLWAEAQELANESLRAAQSTWEVEREELDVMRKELSNAYEYQASDLEEAITKILSLEDRINEQEAQHSTAMRELSFEHSEELRKRKVELEQVYEKLSEIQKEAEHAILKVAEEARRVQDIREELERAYRTIEDEKESKKIILIELDAARKTEVALLSEVQKLGSDIERATDKHQSTFDALSARVLELENELSIAKAERSEAMTDTSIARENLARLEGRLATYQEILQKNEQDKNV